MIQCSAFSNNQAVDFTSKFDVQQLNIKYERNVIFRPINKNKIPASAQTSIRQ